MAHETASQALCHALPKAELHAHLHGCIRLSTLRELASSLSALDEALLADGMGSRSLSDCFRIFSLIHGAVRDTDTVCRILSEAVHDCMADNVRYLELRTTPRAVTTGLHFGAWADPVLAVDHGQYCAALMWALAAEEKRCLKDRLTCRLLLSLNRTEPL
jgi:adenosine deaminase